MPRPRPSALCLAVLALAGCASQAERPAVSLAAFDLTTPAESSGATGRAAGLTEPGPVRTPVEPGARVTEEEIRRALAERAEGGKAALPTRLAVVELVSAGYETVQVQPIAVAELDAFRKGVGGDAPLFERADTIPAPFLPVTVDLANLRYQAARFGADGLILLTRGSNSYSYANGWAFLYPTIVGLAFAPGNTREVWTAAAAVLLDVSSGRPLAVIEAEARVDGHYLVFSDEWAANREIDEEARSRLFRDLGERLRDRAGELRLSQGLPSRHQGFSSK